MVKWKLDFFRRPRNVWFTATLIDCAQRFWYAERAWCNRIGTDVDLVFYLTRLISHVFLLLTNDWYSRFPTRKLSVIWVSIWPGRNCSTITSFLNWKIAHKELLYFLVFIVENRTVCQIANFTQFSQCHCKNTITNCRLAAHNTPQHKVLLVLCGGAFLRLISSNPNHISHTHTRGVTISRVRAHIRHTNTNTHTHTQSWHRIESGVFFVSRGGHCYTEGRTKNGRKCVPLQQRTRHLSVIVCWGWFVFLLVQCMHIWNHFVVYTTLGGTNKLKTNWRDLQVK